MFEKLSLNSFRNKTVCWRLRNPRKLRIIRIVTYLAVNDSTAEDKNDVQKIWKLTTSELSVELENGRVNELDVNCTPDEIELRLKLPKG